jgi:lactoylglutathione lyase
MHLNHLNLPVTDVAETSALLQRHFGLKEISGPSRPGFAVLRDDVGLALALSATREGRTVEYPPTFHIGFIQPSEEQVNTIHAQLLADGLRAPAPARLHGSWTFYFTAPGGFTIEVLC